MHSASFRWIAPCCTLLLLGIAAAAQNGPSAPIADSAQPTAAASGSEAALNSTLPDAPVPQSQQRHPPGAQSDAAVHPQAAEAWRPLNSHEKFMRWESHIYSPYTLESVTFNALYAQAWGYWPGYGGGMAGFGKRFGATLAGTEAHGFFSVFLFPTLLHQDPRYFRSEKHGLVPRGWYAATRVLDTRTDKGGNTFNSSELLSALVTSSLTNAYYPRQDRGFPETANRVIGTYLGDATSNLLREFWPDIKKIVKRHEPSSVQKQMDKLEKTKTWEKIQKHVPNNQQ